MKTILNIFVVLCALAINAALMAEFESKENLESKYGKNSAAVIKVISKLSEKREATMNRNYIKRKQVPFKWGKRSSLNPSSVSNTLVEDYAPIDQCADYFLILVGQNRQELAKYDRAELKLVFERCFGMLVNSFSARHVSESDEANEEAAENNEDEDASSTEIFNSKRNNNNVNVPFRWG